MNDAAFPGNKIVSWLNKRKIPFCLLQEGIRFPLPGESESSYGSNGAKRLFAWGERSSNYFKGVTQPETEIVITGSPRFDQFAEQLKGLNKLTEGRVLGVFTNPIDDQGFCTKQEKLDLFEGFVIRATPYLKTNSIRLGLKCHPREDIHEYVEIANRHYIAFELDKDIRKAIASVDAGVIMASTVGLELLAGNKPIGQLEIPGHGWVFDYIEANSTLKIPVEGSFDLSLLFDAPKETSYFGEHISLGNSVIRITDEVLSLC
ncbi:hypothetical protein [Roseivirga sp.]|uniref:hypothetical protein n=1 Tax=Roseivirga sp. TaxID=1964215 RepID=UPI003B525C57